MENFTFEDNLKSYTTDYIHRQANKYKWLKSKNSENSKL